MEMTLIEKLKVAWEHKGQIAEGLYNTYLNHLPEIKEESKRRLSICEKNSCGFWDASGTNPRLMVPGKPGCVLCGCNGEYKSNCMSCHCSLKDIKEQPLWEELMTNEMEKEIGQKNYENQFNPNK